MRVKKYISKSFIIRLSLLLALVGAAAVFDIYHSANQKLTEKMNRTPASDDTEANKTFFCTQVPTYNLKTLGTEFSVRFRFAYTQDKFILKYYNLRTFQLMKAETLHSSFPVICSFHSLPFNRVLYASPDDTPPLA
ncbi:MAG TPA: hypothetical protein DCR40_07400 [Prolixibacteraceae bacterium]|nr:hypothetical protein [Prolixibacteraceae bacterium]